MKKIYFNLNYYYKKDFINFLIIVFFYLRNYFKKQLYTFIYPLNISKKYYAN